MIYIIKIIQYILDKTGVKPYRFKFHELRMGKPYYDLFIDDKNINSEDYFKINETS